MRANNLIQQISLSNIQEQSNTINNDNSEQQCIKYDQYKVKPLLRGRTQKCIVCKKLCHYSCPKCNKNYCGVEHFRSHNLFCSQQFYEKQVNEGLKGMKVKDKNQKKKAVQMVKKYYEQIQDMQLNAQVTIQRLEQILKIVQQGSEPSLTKKQEYLFKKYLKSLNIDQSQLNNSSQMPILHEGDTCVQLPQIQQQYWQIQQGLSLYLSHITPQIQQLSQTQHPQLVACRLLYSKQLQQFIQQHPFVVQTTLFNSVISAHLLQIVYAYIMMSRMYDAEYTGEFKQIFVNAYSSKQNQALLRVSNVGIKQLISQIDLQIKRQYQHINGVNNKSQSLTTLWLHKYAQNIVNDISIIFNNKYLIIQTLLRIIQSIKQSKQVSNDQIDEIISNESTKSSTSKSKLSNYSKQVIKIIKKCQYLLFYTINGYSPEKCKTYLDQFMTIKRNNPENITPEQIKKDKLFTIVKK